jgi:hypothetical protein
MQRVTKKPNRPVLLPELFHNQLSDEGAHRNLPKDRARDGAPYYCGPNQLEPSEHLALARSLDLGENPNSTHPGDSTPGVFFDSRRLSASALSQATESLRRKTMERDEGTDEFHDSESDVYDLYNACNGVVRDGLLDIRKLDEFTPEEAIALNVPRLREIWKHTASGCTECQRIITTLNTIRETLKEEISESFQQI